MTEKYESYNIKVSTSELADIVSRMERSVLGADRDLIIIAALTLAIGKSDPELIKDDVKFRNTLDSLSHHLCWIITLPTELPTGTIAH